MRVRVLCTRNNTYVPCELCDARMHVVCACEGAYVLACMHVVRAHACMRGCVRACVCPCGCCAWGCDGGVAAAGATAGGRIAGCGATRAPHPDSASAVAAGAAGFVDSF